MGHGYLRVFPNGVQSEEIFTYDDGLFLQMGKAESLTKITEQMIIKFLWQNIVRQFDIPHKLVSDNIK